MRLQITVMRNHLEPVRNVFNTKSKQYKYGSITYVSDLLKAVDSFIQLESDSWGFEDYAVETKLNDSQEAAYELFHWQAIEDVLHDDDEVVIRPISELEMKQRIRGGRHQVRRDGVHLIDGGAWGKGNVLPPDRRPRLFIPPRLRTIAASATTADPSGQEIEEEEELQLQIEDAPHTNEEKVAFLDAEEDDEDDEDDNFVDASTASSRDSSEDDMEDDVEDEVEGSSVPERSLTDKTAALIEQNSSSDHDENQEAIHLQQEHDTGPTSIPQHELAALKADALKAGYRPESKKRKRTEVLQLRRTRRRENSSSGAPMDADSEATSAFGHNSDINGVDKLPNVTFDDRGQTNGEHSETSSSYDDSSSLDSSSESSDSDENDEENTGKYSNQAGHDLDDTSSSNTDSESDSDSSASVSSSDYSSESSSESSESSSESGDSQDSTQPTIAKKTASDSGNNLKLSAIEENSRARPINHIQPPEQVAKENQIQISNLSALSSTQAVPPGSGQNKTKRNNGRKKLNKIMKRLKEEGKLHPEANFEELRSYLQEHEGHEEDREVDTVMTNDVGEDIDELNARREEIFQRLNASNAADQVLENGAELQLLPEDSALEKPDLEDSTNKNTHDVSITEQFATPEEAQSETNPEAQPTVEKPAEESSPKRTRLDVASSRRMLFSALGVRNPKTPAAEQALREKLSKPTRTPKSKAAEDERQTDTTPRVLSTDRWKDKLIVKAVECVQKNKKVEIPPFPFKHPWQVRKEKEMGVYEYREPIFSQEQAGQDQDDYEIEMDYGDDPLRTATALPESISRPAHDKSNEIPIPSDFEILFDLQKSDLVEGAIIAYKELHLNAQFQPEESPYRVARILSNNGTTMQLKLAAEHRRSDQAKYDEETGERMYNKFEMPGADDIPDDGFREMAFRDLIRPKFISPSDSAEIIVAHSQRSDHPEAVDKQVSDQANSQPEGFSKISVVPESINPTNVEVSSSARVEINELIKDAGFDSALDEQLLDPLPERALAKEPIQNDTSEFNEAENNLSTEWRSSPAFETSPGDPFDGRSGLRESSVPSESMVESVRYPQLSHLELDTPLASAQEQSSSHQDAQRVTPTPIGNTSEITHSVLETSGGSRPIETNINPSSLQSEVPQTQYQSQDWAFDSKSSQRNGNKHSSPPDLALDGAASPPHDNTNEISNDSVDSDGFPSLRSLTSSQAQKRKSGKSGEKPQKVSSEATRRSRRINPDDSNVSDRSEAESPPLSIKASQSQKPRMSQIPDEAAVVDLTQSSPADSPIKPSSSKVNTNRRNVSSSQQASVFKKSFEGLGEKSFLKRKKRSL